MDDNIASCYQMVDASNYLDEAFKRGDAEAREERLLRDGVDACAGLLVALIEMKVLIEKGELKEVDWGNDGQR